MTTPNMGGAYGLGSYDSQNKSNWPSFLVEENNQIIFGVVSLVLSFVTGILGLITGAYYLFYLDKTVKKSSLAKYLNIAAFVLPLLGLIIAVAIFLLFVLLGVGMSSV